MTATSELIIALIAPVGARRADLINGLERALEALHFRMVHIRLSSLFERARAVWTAPDGSSEAVRIRHLQDIGNKLRVTTEDPAAVARCGVVAIREQRMQITDDPN